MFLTNFNGRIKSRPKIYIFRKCVNLWHTTKNNRIKQNRSKQFESFSANYDFFWQVNWVLYVESWMMTYDSGYESFHQFCNIWDSWATFGLKRDPLWPSTVSIGFQQFKYTKSIIIFIRPYTTITFIIFIRPYTTITFKNNLGLRRKRDDAMNIILVFANFVSRNGPRASPFHFKRIIFEIFWSFL